MKVCIRDDDTNFYTRPEELEEAYKELWGNIVVTLAVVPFIDKSFFIPLGMKNLKKRVVEDSDLLRKIFSIDENMSKEEFEDYHQCRFIGKNTGLIDYINGKIKEKSVYIVQHGVRHKYYMHGSEMVNSYTKAESILEGKKYIEKTFNTEVDIIVPPNNEIDLSMIGELRQCSMNVLTSGGISYQNIIQKFYVYFRKCTYKDYLYRKVLLKQKNYIFKLDNVKVFNCESIGINTNIDDFLKRLKTISHYSDALCIATHYHELNGNKDYKKRFIYLIEKIKNDVKGVEFVSANKLFD